MLQNDEFTFGLETEFCVARESDLKPLWHEDLGFEELNAAFEEISLDGIPSLDGLELEPPHQKLMPFVVEGYHLPDQDFQARELLPKGVEIRTPVCKSLEECLTVHEELFNRLQASLKKRDWIAVALSHHPVAHHFRGPQNKRRHDFWLWAMEVMTTYGPDMNVGVSADRMKHLDIEDFEAKINHYAAAMTAFSVGSPFRDGKPWTIRGKTGKSLRTYRRSIIAPPIEIHPHENNRLEFKVFDMPSTLQELEAYFLLFVTLLTDESLRGRSSKATRVYDQGAVAIEGFEAEGIVERAESLLESCQRNLPRLGFKTDSLSVLEKRLDSRRTPADEMLDLYERSNQDLSAVLKSLTVLRKT